MTEFLFWCAIWESTNSTPRFGNTLFWCVKLQW